MAILASLAITFAACADPSGPTTPVASYALTSFGTRALPAVMFEEEGYRLEVTAGSATLEADSTFTFSTTVIETVDGNKSTYVDNEAGEWVQGEAGAITFTLSSGEVCSAVWTGTTLTVTRSEMVFVYTMTDE